MKITAQQGDLFAESAPLVVLGAWEGEALPAPVADLMVAEDWAGKAQQTILLYPRTALPTPRLLLVGLGKRAEASPERVRGAAAVATQKARELKVSSIAMAALAADTLDPVAVGQAMAEGALLGSYRFLDFKSNVSDDEGASVTELRVVGEQADALQQGLDLGTAIANGTILARNLANGPGNSVTPAVLADTAVSLSERFGLPVTVLGQRELELEGFGGVLAVAKGSAVEPRVVVLEYGEPADDRPTICLVGKGVTFDSGGISIKPAANMDEMKMDMSGAAAVLGAMQVIAELRLPLRVIGLIGACENMPSATAFKPGDIVKTLSGKTIEVLNTDAEGRVVLADVLFYAQRYQPAAIIDLATLTGACVVALGGVAAGLLANDQSLADRLLQAGEQTSERVWQLPLWSEHKDQVKSQIADIKNAAGREGGTLTAAAFLSHFVGEYPWAHLDIAGTAWTGQHAKAYQPKGATGFGVRLLVEALRSWPQPA